MDRKDWNRIGLAAAVLLVPGGFLLGATLLARRGVKQPVGEPPHAEPSEGDPDDARPADTSTSD